MEENVQAEDRLQATVHGRVQGVSFRFYTRRRAADLGLTGHVRNAWDGTVEVIAEGRRADLEQLLAFLRVGPPAAVVTNVDVRWIAPTNTLDRFEVRY